MTTTVPFIPETAPFSLEQRAWLNGFLASFIGGKILPNQPSAARASVPLLILYGSQSGNAEGLAKKLAKHAKARGFATQVQELDAIDPASLPQHRHVAILISTWGEGEMPDNAQSFWSRFNDPASALKLASVNYAVLALGDKNYTETYCQAGRLLDARFADLGANAILPRVECDVDFDGEATKWSEALCSLMQPSDGTADAVAVAEVELEETLTWSKQRPFPAKLMANRCLNAQKSDKDTRHVEFSLAGSGLEYDVGDALGVCVKNCPGVVSTLLAKLGFDAQTPVLLGSGEKVSLHAALTEKFEIRSLLTQSVAFASPQEFVESLRKLHPRLYSISSSPVAHPGEVHLTVGVVRYT